MKNKGFTLIELLAVIVILALIALVTIPMINNVIEKAKKGALEDSVYGLKSAAELYYSTTGTSETIEFTCDETGCKDGDKKLPFKGTVNEGRVKLFSDGKVSICIENDDFASSILAEDKKVTTTTGSCDYTKEEYAITELVSANEYKKVKEENKAIKNALYNKTLISSLDLSKENIVEEINNLDLSATSYEIYEDGKRVSGYPDGSYNVDVKCEGAIGTWNNTYKGVILSNVNSEDVKCRINFETCTTGNCDTNTIAWVNWVTLLGYNPDNYSDLKDFLSKEMAIASCADIDKLYNNDNGAYDYLKSQSSLIKEINQNMDFSACSIAFDYSGSVQQYDASQSGIYKLEVYGAQGGSYSSYVGGAGGSSIGYKKISMGETLYVVVGAQGGYSRTTSMASSKSARSYNGGGLAISVSCGTSGAYYAAGAGGGATHIATTNRGELKNYASYKNEVLIVAGGGGGATVTTEYAAYSNGTAGGGTSGASSVDGGTGGTQSSGYAFGQGQDATTTNGTQSGGGGGWYGGTTTKTNFGVGGGGSGYIGGVSIFALNGINYAPETKNGVRSGNGYAKITFAGIY